MEILRNARLLRLEKSSNFLFFFGVDRVVTLRTKIGISV